MPHHGRVRIRPADAGRDLELETHISASGGVDAEETAGIFAMFAVCASSNKDAVLVKNGRVEEMIAGVTIGYGRKVNIELPKQFAGQGVEGAHPAIAQGRDDLPATADSGHQ